MTKSTKLTLSAMFLSILFEATIEKGQIPQIGNMLCPTHIPVLLCGLLCGWRCGAAVGFVLPLFRGSLLGFPPLFPNGIAMAFELAVYGGVAGALYARSRWKCLLALYRSLLIAMVGGRIVWGVVRALLSGVGGEPFTWQLFLSGALLLAVPGIVFQLVLIPAVMVALDRTGMVHFQKKLEPAESGACPTAGKS